MGMKRRWITAAFVAAVAGRSMGLEQQITFTAKNHDLDNNDNFSRDGQWLCYDTRETTGPGIDNCTSIEAVNIATGEERLLYRPEAVVTGSRPAPGIGAVSFSPVEDTVIFIHGPAVSELGARGPYAKPNRQGAIVPLDGSGKVSWADCRDTAQDRDTLPGAHRGGTHRHEYSLDGQRIGFTYDDFLLPQYDRTIGCLVPSGDAPGGASHYFMILVPVVPKDTAKPGEIEKAWGDSWVGKAGTLRAFIGKVRNEDGATYEQSLYVVEIPEKIDLKSIDSGARDRFPAPPSGTKIRRITQGFADGIVRGSWDGAQIAYYGRDAQGQLQVFVVPVDGSDTASDTAKRPKQVTRFDGGVAQYVRWRPDGQSIFCVTSKGGIAQVQLSNGDVQWLAPEDGAERSRLVVSPDGKRVAYDKPVATPGEHGAAAKTYDGKDFMQIFVADSL